MAKLIVVRDTSIPDAFRGYVVLLDGREVGALKPSDRLELDIAPGPHTLALKIDWCGSQTARFEVGADDQVRYAARTNLAGLRMLLGAWYILFQRDDYLALQRLA